MLAAIAFAPDAAAQRLNLDGPTHAGPGECAAILTLADDTEARTPAGGDAASKARSAVARLAAEILRRSERASPPSPRNILLGMTLAGRLPLLGDAFSNADPVLLASIATDAATLAANPPTDPDALALAVRDVLAPLTESRPADQPANPRNNQDAWTCEPSPGPSGEDILATLRSSPGGIGESMTALDRRFAAAEHLAAYAPVIRAARTRIAAAGRLTVKPPAWLPAHAKQALGRQLTDALKRMVDEPQSAETVRRLDRLVLLERIASGLDSQRGASATRAQHALARIASTGPTDDPTAREAERRKHAGIAAAADLLPQRERTRDERSIVRQFRPALRTMQELAKLTEADLLEVLPETMDSPAADAINDPKFVAAVAAHKRRLDDLAAIVDASAAILTAQGAPPSPTADAAARDEYKLLGDRLLAYAKDAYDLAQKNDPLLRDQLERALAKVRGLTVDARDFAELPGEAELHDAAKGSPSAALLGKNTEPLLKMLDADRTAWLKGWGSPDKAPVESGTRLRRLHDLLLALGDAAQVEQIRTSGAFAAWPGWEAPPASLGVLAVDLNDSVIAAIEAHLAGTPDAPALAKSLVDRFAPALLAGRIARTLPGCGGPLAEVTAGPPNRDAPMFDRLADLAMVSRESHELAARIARKEEVSRLRAAVTTLAAACWHEAPRPAHGSRTR